jgi:threonylcarbamoyladenosine tRNA methylthiotransferase MtaB
VKLAEELAEKNVKEIVLTGVNIGDFGKSTGETFLDLIKQLDKVEGIERFRISSIEPNLLSNEIIDFVAQSQKFVPHFHIPLQAGSDEVLKLMRRRYDTALYTERINRIRTTMPNACIGVDVITGTRGESPEFFLETYNYLNELDISYLHVFTYSERANTTALRHNFNVPYAERKKRTAMLRILSDKKRMAFYQKHLGEKRKVLIEEENNGKFMYGFTDNYVKVRLPYDPLYTNEVREVKLKAINEEGTVDAHLTLIEDIPEKYKSQTITA